MNDFQPIIQLVPEFNKLHPLEAMEVWKKILPGLEYLASIDQTPGHWTVKDVFDSLYNAGATLGLLSVTAPGSDDGFVILRKLNDINHSNLHIWILWSATHKGVMRIFSDQIDMIARNVGCKYTTFGSTLPMWNKLAPKHGYSVKEITYERAVKDL